MGENKEILQTKYWKLRGLFKKKKKDKTETFVQIESDVTIY